MAHAYSPSAMDLAKVDRANASGKHSVVFVHRLWLLDSSWDHWAQFFRGRRVRSGRPDLA